MTYELNNEITYLKGVGEKRAGLYKKLGVNTIGDLLTHYPRSYTDFTSPKNLADLENGEICVFSGTVIKKFSPIFSRVSIYRVMIDDGSDQLLCTFFNSEYIFQRLIIGNSYIFYGKINFDFTKKECASPIFIDENDENRIIPRYALTAGLSNNIISSNMKAALSNVQLIDRLPLQIRDKNGLCTLSEAVNNIHFPHSLEQLEMAKKRLAFEELLVLQLGLNMLKKHARRLSGVTLKRVKMDEFYRSLPYSPTNAQLRSIGEAISDMTSQTPMNRLLQGDVGSGKTLVAASLIFVCAKNGCQSTLMAPTEILAKQHYETLCGFLEPLGITIGLLTGSLTAKEKNDVKKRIKSGEIAIAVGTHALIQKDVEFERLALVITDEQHRFGVSQRSTLAEKGLNPHNLVISATPIPRTLALMIYGDLDISVLDEMPKGRLPIKTYTVNTSYHERLYKFIIKYVNEGYQAYIVCPLVDGEESEKTAAAKYYQSLSNTHFKGISVGLLHGKMKQSDKDEVMLKFKSNRISVLVSTTVVEVGVDVPNAVVMVIENAEQFGLSQLHQLRGRVGRGNVQSHCILVSDSETPYTRARLDTMVATSDGFVIANKDLELRGPGDFFGTAQHGLPPLKIASMTEDTMLIRQVQMVAKEVLEADETLSNAENKGLSELITELFNRTDYFSYN